jgi:hypothetical protein
MANRGDKLRRVSLFLNNTTHFLRPGEMGYNRLGRSA